MLPFGDLSTSEYNCLTQELEFSLFDNIKNSSLIKKCLCEFEKNINKFKKKQYFC